jgi:ADP-ribosylglycohydrolase
LVAGESIAESGRYGTTNGAAMRIPPIGVAVDVRDLIALVDTVEEVSRVTHNTGIAIAGAAAIAAAVSAGVSGASVKDAIGVAQEAAVLGSQRGYWMAGADVATRIQWAVSLAQSHGRTDDLLDVIYRLIGTSVATQESIPAAFAILAAYPSDPWEGCCLAASLGGDTDTIGALVGAVGGACCGVDAFPSSVIEAVAAVNQLALEPIAHGLLNLRDDAR